MTWYWSLRLVVSFSVFIFKGMFGNAAAAYVSSKDSGQTGFRSDHVQTGLSLRFLYCI